MGLWWQYNFVGLRQSEVLTFLPRDRQEGLHILAACLVRCMSWMSCHVFVVMAG